MSSALLDKDVVQANPLVRARKEMNLTELRLFVLGLQDIEPHIKDDIIHDLDFHETKITYSELVDLFGSEHNGNVSNLKKQVEKAYDAKIRLSYEDGGFGFRHIYRKIDYIPQEGLTILFDDEIKPYILEIVNQQYTKYKLKAVFALSSTYAWRLLETLLENQGYLKKGKRKIYKTLTVEEIRFRLNVGEGLYKGRMNNFKRKVLDEPIEDINRKTDYHVWYDTIKTGRKTTGFTFWLEVKERTSLPDISQDFSSEERIEKYALSEPVLPAGTGDGKDTLSEGEKEIFAKITNPNKWNVSSNTAVKLIQTFGIARVEKNLLYCDKHRAGKINLGGFLIEMIRLDAAGDEERRVADKRHEDDKQKERNREGLLKEIAESKEESKSKIKPLMTEENRKLGKEKLSQIKEIVTRNRKFVSTDDADKNTKPTLEDELELQGQQRLFEKPKDEEENESIFDNESEKTAFKSEFANVMKSNLSNEEKLEKILSMEGDDETGNLLKILSLLIETSGTVNRYGHREIKLQ